MVGLLLGCGGTVSGPPPGQTLGPDGTGGPSSGSPGGTGSDPTGVGGSSTAGTGGASTAGAGAGTSTATGGAGAGASTATGGSVGTGGDTASLCDPSAATLQVGLTKLRRMTRSEFNHTVRDLLGISGTPADALAPDERVGPFYSNAIAPVTDLLVQQHDELAAALAGQVAPQMNSVAGCDLAADTGTACATQFIESFGLKAYRRPLEPQERDEYLTLYTTELATGTPESAFRQVLSTMLESPFFLYHADVGTSGVPSATPMPLSSYEIASRLSYFLWESMPDQELFTLAGSGSLQDDTVLAQQVDRMLADPKAADSIPEFHVQWLGIDGLLGLDKDPAIFPQYNDVLATAMTAETATFTDFVVRQGDGLMSTLFTAGFSFPQGPLFSLYGITEPAGFVPGTQVSMNPAERSGLLTQAAFLTAHAHRDQTSPVHRGISVRENMLCQPLDPPPLNVNTTPPPPSTATTTRERFAEHEANPTCAGCHIMIDPIGLAFENYDGVGAYRTMEGSGPVDASGEIIGGAPELDGPFVGVLELSQKLAQSRTVADCLANQWFRFALGRMESEDDACSMQAIHDGFAASGNNVRQLLVNIVKSDAFRNVRSTAVVQ